MPREGATDCARGSSGAVCGMRILAGVHPLRCGFGERSLRPHQMGVAGFPIDRQPDRFGTGHLDEGEALAAVDHEGLIGFADHIERAPEAHAFDRIEPGADEEVIAEFGGAFVVDLGAEDDGVEAGLAHRREMPSELFGEEGARGLDVAQIREVVDHRGTIGVVKHHLDAEFELRGLGFGHAPEHAQGTSKIQHRTTGDQWPVAGGQ